MLMNMKKLIVAFMILFSVTASAQSFNIVPGDKAAMLMVHFGSTYEDARRESIDAINAKAATEFDGMDVVEAYTSRMVIKRLKKRGIDKPTPIEALLRLAADGYTHVLVQSTNVIDGIEAENLRNEVSSMNRFFKDVRVGHPLLYSVDDCRKVVDILVSRHIDAMGRKSHVVFVGHGTETPANAIYSQIDYMLSDAGHPECHVATIEGYPDFDSLIARLRKDGARQVCLVPFMFVAGDHARNDIDDEWRKRLEENGLKVTTVMEGLGSISEIQDIFIDHARDAMNSRPLSATQIKSEFLKNNAD